MRWYGATLLLGILSGCGAGGGGGGQSSAISFGTVTANAPTVRNVAFANPVAGASTVEAVGATGPFRAADGELPAFAPGGADFAVGVQFEPPGPGEFTGTVTIRFVPAGGGSSSEVTVAVRATAEAAKPSTPTAGLDFGDVLVTTTATRKLTLFNAAAHTSYRVFAPLLPDGFSFPAVSFPITMAPRETRVLDLAYAPAAPTTHAFDLVFPHDAGVGVTLKVPVAARTSGWPEEVVVEYGDVALDANGDTPWLEVEVPMDAISLTVEATATKAETIELSGLEWPGGYAPALPPAGLQWPTWKRGIRSVTVPWTDLGTEQLAPGGGTYRFRFRRESGPAPTLRVRALIESRPGAVVAAGVVDLNVFVAASYNLTPAQVPAWFQSTVAAADPLLATAGLRIGNVTGYILDPLFNQVDITSGPYAMQALFEQSANAVETRVNVFVTWLVPIGGAAGMVQGPASNGWSESGVVVNGPGNGYYVAHEIGHYLGLHHIQQDAITDTNPLTTDNVMWNGTTFTPGQAYVILRHPLVRSP